MDLMSITTKFSQISKTQLSNQKNHLFFLTKTHCANTFVRVTINPINVVYQGLLFISHMSEIRGRSLAVDSFNCHSPMAHNLKGKKSESQMPKSESQIPR